MNNRNGDYDASLEAPTPPIDLIDAARKALARSVAPGENPKPRDLRLAADIMEGKWDHTPAFKTELARVWMAS